MGEESQRGERRGGRGREGVIWNMSSRVLRVIVDGLDVTCHS